VFNPILILIGLTVAISAYAWSKPELMRAWILEPYVMARSSGQWYRLLTSGFLHADWSHLLFNMFAFYSFSPVVLSTLAESYGSGAGVGLFLLLYLGALSYPIYHLTSSTATTVTTVAWVRRGG